MKWPVALLFMLLDGFVSVAPAIVGINLALALWVSWRGPLTAQQHLGSAVAATLLFIAAYAVCISLSKRLREWFK